MTTTTTINNHLTLIDQVGGIEKAKAIVEGVPDSHYCTGISDYTDGYDDDEKCPDCVGIQDLRTAIAEYDCIDTCSDIANHISPLTKVTER